MTTGAADTVFLAFDVMKFFRTVPMHYSMLMFLGAALFLFGIVYLYFAYVKPASSGELAAAPAEKENIQEKMVEKRDKLMEEREKRLKSIPSGPIEASDLPVATIRIRNRVENINPDTEFKIGKSPDNDLVIPELGVSRWHAKIRPDRAGYVIYDLVSSRGTAVNGQKVVKRVLRNDDQIKIGPETLIFKLPE